MAKQPNMFVVGMFWGDEGKAKIVDLLTENANVVVRYQGGANAGHSVEIDGERFVLHQVPTGILHPEKTCVLGAGMVIDMPALANELAELEKQGISWRGRIMISPRAHFVLPYHKQIEEIAEAKAGIGTTKRGIGPAYRDKATRIGIRLGDALLGKANLIAKLERWISESGEMFKKAYSVDFQSPPDVAATIMSAVDFVGDAISSPGAYIDETARTKGGILAEGAQGTMLSVSWGTYPFVTSSETTAGGAATGLGIDMRLFDKIIGVAKAFCTRVGNGPFPTEGDEELQRKLRGTGEHAYDEFGSTTGRPRRCGWLDGVVLRYATRINGIDAIALTKLDCLSGIDELKIAAKYVDYAEFPVTSEEAEKVEPIYKTFPGWNEDISRINDFSKLPADAQRYVHEIERIAMVPVEFVGVGPGRKDIILK